MSIVERIYLSAWRVMACQVSRMIREALTSRAKDFNIVLDDVALVGEWMMAAVIA